MSKSVMYIAPERAALEENLLYIKFCQSIRRKVFVEGQGVAEEIDFDGNDLVSGHLLIYVDGSAVGTARIRKTTRGTKLERIAVLPSHRGQGLGELLIRCALALIEDEVYIHAQMASLGFYTHLGFVQEKAEIFYEANIPHTAMIYPHPRGELPCEITRL
ncbi:MAG: GNAT family N-acetyltransferase [Sphaerochaeta sp.]